MREKINRWLELKRYNWKNLDISLLVVVSILLLISTYVLSIVQGDSFSLKRQLFGIIAGFVIVFIFVSPGRKRLNVRPVRFCGFRRRFRESSCSPGSAVRFCRKRSADSENSRDCRRACGSRAGWNRRCRSPWANRRGRFPAGGRTPGG